MCVVCNRNIRLTRAGGTIGCVDGAMRRAKAGRVAGMPPFRARQNVILKEQRDGRICQPTLLHQITCDVRHLRWRSIGWRLEASACHLHLRGNRQALRVPVRQSGRSREYPLPTRHLTVPVRQSGCSREYPLPTRHLTVPVRQSGCSREYPLPTRHLTVPVRPTPTSYAVAQSAWTR